MARALSDEQVARYQEDGFLCQALIQRVEQNDGQTRAFVTPTFDLARRQVRQAEAEISAGTLRGHLHGIPFGLKDMDDTQGILTSAHSRIFIGG